VVAWISGLVLYEEIRSQPWGSPGETFLVSTTEASKSGFQ